jgi:hypothetical protein
VGSLYDEGMDLSFTVAVGRLQRSPAGLMAIFHCLSFETPPSGGPGLCIHIP